MLIVKKTINGKEFILLVDVADEMISINVSCMTDILSVENPMTLSRFPGEEFIPLWVAIKISTHPEEEKVLEGLLKDAKDAIEYGKKEMED